MSATKQDIEDFNYIMTEWFRLGDLLSKSFDLYINEFTSPLNSLFSTINIPHDILDKNTADNDFQIHLSESSKQKLFNISCREIKKHNLKYDITVSEYVVELKSALYIHIKNRKSFDNAGCSSLLSLALKRAKKSMFSIEYFFPFNSDGIQNDICLGDSIIVSINKVIDKVDDYGEYKIFVKDDNDIDYDSFICIPIPKCSHEISKIRANNVAQLIYGIIKVFTTSYGLDSSSIRLKKNPHNQQSSHYITKIEENYHMCGSCSFKRNLSNFWIYFEDDLNSDLGLIIKNIVDISISPSLKNILADRLIDSFCWFGDATRDNNESSQIVKLVTSLERLVTLSIEKDDGKLTSRFCNRINSFAQVYHRDESDWLVEAKKIYKLRSNLVHGSQSLFKSYDMSLGFDPFRISQISILTACIIFSNLGLDSHSYEYELQNCYNKLEEKQLM